jgi:fengycin family lipopeptide synthetase E
MLGILKAGKIYVLLDSVHPRARIAAMLEDSRAAFIVTNDRQLAFAKTAAQNLCQLTNIDTFDPSLSAKNLGISHSPEAIFGIFYASGSTGSPKGAIEN